MGKSNHNNEGSHMYARDYRDSPSVADTVKHNHETKTALLAKVAAKLRGRGGRFRGKNGTQENNKARGGNRAL